MRCYFFIVTFCAKNSERSTGLSGRSENLISLSFYGESCFFPYRQRTYIHQCCSLAFFKGSFVLQMSARQIEKGLLRSSVSRFWQVLKLRYNLYGWFWKYSSAAILEPTFHTPFKLCRVNLFGSGKGVGRLQRFPL